MNTTRIKLVGVVGQGLTTEQQLLLENLIDYGEVSPKHFDDRGIMRRPLLPIAESLTALGHHIYMKVDLDANGEDIEASRVFYMDDCSFITERRLGMPGAVTIPDVNIDFNS